MTHNGSGPTSTAVEDGARKSDQLDGSIASENKPSTNANQDQRWKAVRVHIAKGDKAVEKAEQHYVAAGRYLKDLKAQHSGSWANWEKLLKDKIGIGKSRASELMQIADGRKTAEQVSASTTARSRKRRSLSSPLRNGETAKPPSSRAVAVVEQDEDESFLDDEGNFAPADLEADAACRIRGFLYRAEQSAFAAEADDFTGLTITREVQKAAAKAAEAWQLLAQRLIKEVKEAKPDDGLDIPACLRRAVS